MRFGWKIFHPKILSTKMVKFALFMSTEGHPVW
jgi:hypothetical protein